jgi:probable O-glycosylation ligase (exosortase A-associated)
MSIPLCLFLLVDARKTLLKLVFVGTLMFLVMSVAATQSRGGTLALVAVGLYYWWNSDRKVLTGVLACGAIAIVMTLAPSHYFERLQSISTYEEDTSAMGRVNAWKAGTQMMLANPILGVGAGHFGRNFTKYVPGGEDFRWKTAHSVYFLAMGELGVPGIALLLTFLGTNLVVTMKRGREVRKRGDPEAVTDARLLACVCVSLVAFAIAGAFLSALYYPHMAVLSALFVVSRRIVKERKTVPQVALAAPSKPEMTYHWALRPLMELHTASLRVGNKGSST